MVWHHQATNHYLNQCWPRSVLPSLIARFMGPTWGPHGSCRPQMGPILAHEPFYMGYGVTRPQWVKHSQVAKIHSQGRHEYPLYIESIWWQLITSWDKEPGPWFNIKMSSYQYRESHCGDLHNGISYTGKMPSLYWIRAQGISGQDTDLAPTVNFI